MREGINIGCPAVVRITRVRLHQEKGVIAQGESD
jgi:hypothetical protein